VDSYLVVGIRYR